MTDFQRYAVYYLPPEGALAEFGASWLGWDAAEGRAVPHPADLDPGLDIAALTATPRRYGFHATIKPPFRLAAGRSARELSIAFHDFCARQQPVMLERLELTRLGGFLALTPPGDTGALARLAAAAVRDLDGFRAPAPEAELARRRGAGLSPRQEENLARWGYPHVMEEFRFHMTLSGRIADAQQRARLQAALAPVLEPILPAPFGIDTLCLVGADAEDRFRLIERLQLRGQPES
ncbi:DUF1045 domain-containing protein [Mangrovicoccus algicola]|uniref:DUF1045 domain-containing protein n=1 Tax=Mangrovicoccus algicola TaxID=2771008 RepID=A0A8J6YTZ6_9RHOB|nr:DUF1045 domain-containing protein [Mangrovicoccus algicola]MBE3637507.1 DUF1045 domain-containing protein [Mangrovicoccus algicola]